jgi:hypothetical protein
LVVLCALVVLTDSNHDAERSEAQLLRHFTGTLSKDVSH